MWADARVVLNGVLSETALLKLPRVTLSPVTKRDDYGQTLILLGADTLRKQLSGILWDISATRTVREELGVEVEGHDRHDAGEREIVEIWIILLAEPAVGTVSTCYQYAIKVQLSSKYSLLRHDIVVELLFRVLGSELNILCEQPGRDVMVITATVVIVFFIRGYVGLHSRMPV